MLQRNRKLGKSQKQWLVALRDFGEWHRGSCWWVGSPFNSKKVCESLVRRGLAYRDRTADAQISGHGPIYRLTQLGLEKANECAEQ